jgi:hypothetical protein
MEIIRVELQRATATQESLGARVEPRLP